MAIIFNKVINLMSVFLSGICLLVLDLEASKTMIVFVLTIISLIVRIIADFDKFTAKLNHWLNIFFSFFKKK